MDRIGVDIIKEIFSYPMTLNTFLSLRRVSRKIKELVEGNVQVLIYDEEEEERQRKFLHPEIILRMKKIREIAPKYNVLAEYHPRFSVMKYKNYLRELLLHPTLLSANLSVLDAKEKTSTFPHYVKGNKKNYNFTLRTKSTNEYITLTDKRVTFHYVVDYDKDQRYLKNRIDFDEEVTELAFIDCSLDIFDCLEKYTRDKIYLNKIIIDYRNESSIETYSLGEILANKLNYKEAVEYHLFVSEIAVRNYYKILKSLLRRLEERRSCFARIKKFFPLPLKLNYLNTARNLFPHLTTLTIIGQGIKKNNITPQCIDFIDNYRRINIIVYNKQECDYRSLFPSYLRDKIKLCQG